MVPYQPQHAKGNITPDIFSWFTPRIRAWFYGILTAVIPLLIAYGVLDAQQAPLWVAFAAAILGQGSAWLHTPSPSTTANSEGEDPTLGAKPQQ